ncbi:MAG: hypothetical protein Ct9H300mP1_17200 [Planctomycetaceae bacterium]|nr:MAG: hypothetical protein Ct9H300mP1_17200 [Planctomycetaceae bacterium]
MGRPPNREPSTVKTVARVTVASVCPEGKSVSGFCQPVCTDQGMEIWGFPDAAGSG